MEFAPSAARTLRGLAPDVRRRLAPRIEALAEQPRPPGVEKLAGADDLYRVRVGDYRIVYAIKDEVLLVLVVRVGHRRDVYRR